MSKISRYALIVLFLSPWGGSVFAQPGDKSPYHLFNPTPVVQMRELIGDRPDGTESPTTVDAGHIQIETSLIDYSENHFEGTDFEALTTAATNVRVGLFNNLELQIVFDVYAHEQTQALGIKQEAEGFSDITLRPKLNLWGNDSGSSALAIMPFVKIPTDTELSNGEIEGGLIIPFGMELTDRVGLGLMAEIDWVYDADHDDYDTEVIHTAVIGFDATQTIGIYLEYIGVVGPDDYQPFFSGGATLALTENLVFDFGAVIGLNDAANDLNIFSGFTVRF